MLVQPSGTSNWYDALEYTFQVRWSGTKDGKKSKKLAEKCRWMLTPFADEPLSVLLVPGAGMQVREKLKLLGMSPATVNRHLSSFLSVWRECYRAGAVQHPVPEGLYLREPSGRNRVVDPVEYLTLLGLLDPLHQMLVRVLYATGCRVSEALKLEEPDWSFVPGGAGVIRFRGTKNGDDREVPLPAGLIPVYGLGDRISQADFNRAWNRARDAMGLSSDPGFVPHALRHTYVSRLVAAGVPIAVVARLAGHRSLKTTLRYTHLTAGDCRAALERAGLS